MLFGLIAAMAGRIWVETRVHSQTHKISSPSRRHSRRVLADLTFKFGNFTMGGIGTATFGAIILYQIFGWSKAKD